MTEWEPTMELRLVERYESTSGDLVKRIVLQQRWRKLIDAASFTIPSHHVISGTVAISSDVLRFGFGPAYDYEWCDIPVVTE